MSTMTITASMVNELRKQTGAGMMECKKALTETAGDMDLALQRLREWGATKAGKKASRIAAEGAIAIVNNGQQAAMIEVNSETDFVARDANFTAFVQAVAKTVLSAGSQNIQDINAILQLSLQGFDQQTIESARQALVAKVGENVQIRRCIVSQPAAIAGSYLHGNRIGVVVEVDVETVNEETITLARDIAMHIAASKPMVVHPEDVAEELISKEKEIYTAQAATSGKPPEIIEKMVMGRLKKYLDEVSLVGQPFVKDPEVSIGHLLNKHRAKVRAFYRYEVGEGIEKVTEDFKEAVMSMSKTQDG